ncbi:MAG TPA: glycosyltransferase family 4 protein [Candidatus Paceibacterota bacterium]|nr:glycosyltransferase family 4 protein [Candidatus Paceibacterota bacterium]
MRLLFITQALDLDDPVLSAYHRLVNETAKNFDSVVAVCLKKGRCELPANVTIRSLGKERGGSRLAAKLRYVSRFYKYVFAERYDAVFVHMNQEYILLGGPFWKMMGKRIYMWRNHHAGSLLTDIAAAFCAKVFCTSRFSYTAKYKKTVLMPVGIDTQTFKPVPDTRRIPGSILFLARMAPVKKPDLFIEILLRLEKSNVPFTASLYGDPLPKDEIFYKLLQEKVAALGLGDKTVFYHGVPNGATPGIYSAHDVSVNLSSSGMYDKTIFEAMACETLVVATNKNLDGLVPAEFVAKEGDAEEIAGKISHLLGLSALEKDSYRKKLRATAEAKHSLAMLGKRLAEEVVERII